MEARSYMIESILKQCFEGVGVIVFTKQRFLGINTEFGSLNYNNFDENIFTSSISFLDYDVVVISTNFVSSRYPESSTSPYQNKRLLSNYASNQITEDYKIIKEQLIELLKQGKMVFILMGSNENCYIYTGEKQYSGTGKNARQTNIVTEFDMYSFLPIKITATHVYGERIEICGKQPFINFFKKSNECFHYAAYFTAPQPSMLLKIPGTSKAVSAVFEYENGKIILLPLPYYEDDYTEEKYWRKYGKIYLDALFELSERLSTSLDDYVLPDWTNYFSILNETAESIKLEKDLQRLKKIQRSIEKQEELICQIQRYKTLLTASGDQLEDIVKLVLSELGFSLLEAEKGRSDIIAKYGETDIVAEIKGVTKSAAEKHAAQLEKWVAQFTEENEHAPKPLLIVNGFCDTPLLERVENVFPNQMLKYCEARNHVLVTTTQLLCLYIETRNDLSCLDERINGLLSTVGIYQPYQNITDFIKPIT